VTWKKNVRTVGITLSAASLGLLAAEGTAGAHESDSVPDQVFGTVTSVATDSITVQTPDGTSQTVATTPSTTYRETGTSTVPTVADGDHVDVRLDPADATPTATAITLLLDRLSGRVVSVDGSTVRLAERHGFRDFLTTASTTYNEVPSTSTSTTSAPTGLTPGEYVTAFGLPSSSTPSEIVAQFVDIVSTKIPTPPKPVPPQPVKFPAGTTPTTWPVRPLTAKPGPITPPAAVNRPQTTSPPADPGSPWKPDPQGSNPQPQGPAQGHGGPANGSAGSGRGGGSFGGNDH
jgi:hypothetical protein